MGVMAGMQPSLSAEELMNIRIAIKHKRRSADDIPSLNAILLIHPHERFNREPWCLSGSVMILLADVHPGLQTSPLRRHKTLLSQD